MNYTEKVDMHNLKSQVDEGRRLVKQLFAVLHRVEDNDSGTRYFNPTYISSVRVMETEKLKKILPALRQWADVPEGEDVSKLNAEREAEWAQGAEEVDAAPLGDEIVGPSGL